jgi:hypothetical protein
VKGKLRIKIEFNHLVRIFLQRNIKDINKNGARPHLLKIWSAI